MQHPDWIVRADDPTAALLDAMPDTWQVMTLGQMRMLSEWCRWNLIGTWLGDMLTAKPASLLAVTIRSQGEMVILVRRLRGLHPQATVEANRLVTDWLASVLSRPGADDIKPSEACDHLERLTQQWLAPRE